MYNENIYSKICGWDMKDCQILVRLNNLQYLQPLDKGYLDRGVKERKSLCVLRETMMPAALVELGFIDSADVRFLKEHQEEMARAVARGVTDYWRML